MADFDAMLLKAYRAAGEPAVHVSAETGAQTPVHVDFDAGGGRSHLADLVRGDAPSLQLPTTAVAAGIRKGDRFEIGTATWVASADAVPVGSGEELLVHLKKAT